MKKLLVAAMMMLCYVCNAQTEFSFSPFVVGWERDSIPDFFTVENYTITNSRRHLRLKSNVENVKISYKLDRHGVAKSLFAYKDYSDVNDFANAIKFIRSMVNCECYYNGMDKTYYFNWYNIYIEISYRKGTIYIISKKVR